MSNCQIPHIYVFTPCTSTSRQIRENQIKKWNVCPRLVVLVPPVAAARAGSVCVQGDYTSLDLTSPHWLGGGRRREPGIQSEKVFVIRGLEH